MKTLFGMNYYRPSEVADRAMITSSRGQSSAKSNYEYILSQIRAGRLRARNVGRVEGHNYYLIAEDEIDRFNRQQVGL